MTSTLASFKFVRIRTHSLDLAETERKNKRSSSYALGNTLMHDGRIDECIQFVTDLTLALLRARTGTEDLVKLFK